MNTVGARKEFLRTDRLIIYATTALLHDPFPRRLVPLGWERGEAVWMIDGGTRHTSRELRVGFYTAPYILPRGSPLSQPSGARRLGVGLGAYASSYRER